MAGAEDFFAGRGVYFLPGKEPKPTMLKFMTSTVERFGGRVEDEPSKAVDFVVCSLGAVDGDAGEALAKCGSGAVAVKARWLDHCARDKKLQPGDEYALPKHAPSAPPAAAGGAAAGGGQKRAAEGGGEPPAKRVAEGMAHANGASGSGGGSSSSSAAAAPAAHDKPKDKPKAAEVKMAPLFTKRSESKAPWHHSASEGSLRWLSEGFTPTPKVASFDMDFTIIQTKSGNKFPKDVNDWKLIQETKLRRKLQSLIDDGYCIVLISNQGGIKAEGKKGGATTVESLQHKIGNVQAALRLPLCFMAAYRKNILRKPCPGMWWGLEKHFEGLGVKVRKNESFYVGDAAGRPFGRRPWHGGKDEKDFSDSDRNFAWNVGVAFHTPEEFFLGAETEHFEYKHFDARAWRDRAAGKEPAQVKKGDGVEIVLMCGFPGSGKSTFAKRVFETQGFVWINRDTLKSMDKCMEVARMSLARRESVVIDNTNPSKQARAPFIEIGKKFKARIRCFRMGVGRDLAEHNNAVRGIITKGETLIPQMAFSKFEMEFEKPTKEEGFDEVVEAALRPEDLRFETDLHEQAFYWRFSK